MDSPRHLQLAESLLAEIVDGTYAIGDRLPTEEKLCASHRMARGTVRRALGHLEDLGMISRRPGAGTTVMASAPLARYQPVAQSPADIAALAADTKLVKFETREVVLSATLARRLGARPGTTWLLVEGPRVRKVGSKVPLCWSQHYIRGDVPRENFLRGIIRVEEVARTRVEQTIYADFLETRIAEALEATPGSPALVVARRARDSRGRLVSVGIHIHPGDRYAITTIL